MTAIKPHPLSYHSEELTRRKSAITSERDSLAAEHARLTAIVGKYTDNLPPGGLNEAVAAESQRQALAALVDKTHGNLSFRHEKTEQSYMNDEAESVAASAEMELEKVVKDFPKTKETFMSRIATLTREALGLSANNRGELLVARDDQEEKLIALESLVDKARTDIARYRSSPTTESFNSIIGTLGMLNHELSKVAAA